MSSVGSLLFVLTLYFMLRGCCFLVILSNFGLICGAFCLDFGDLHLTVEVYIVAEFFHPDVVDDRVLETRHEPQP